MGRVHGDLLVKGFVLSMPTHNTREGIEEKLVKHLVDRFCGWHLPKDFHPDGGIMFMDVYDNGTEQGGTFEPTGTNLFTAEQAKEMFRFLLEHEDGRPILAELFHQELQKAREESGKRNAVVKEYQDEGVMFILKIEDGKTYEASMPIPKWAEIGKLTLRDQSELDQPTV